MKHLTKILFLTLFIMQQSIAQKLFVEGYIVTNQQDTIRGFLREKTHISKEIIFKKTKEGTQSRVYRPSALRLAYFKPTNEYYYSKLVDIDIKPNDMVQLEYNTKPKLVKDTVFLKAIVKAPLTLYMLSGWDDKNHFFTEQNNQEPKELFLISHQVGGGLYSIKPLYRSQLTEIISDCPTLSSNETVHNEKSLKALVLDYNNCKKFNVSYVRVSDKIKLIPYVYTGLTNKGINYQSNGVGLGLSYMDGLQFSQSLNVTFGAGIEFVSPRRSNPIAFGLDLFLKQSSFNGNLDAYGNTITALAEATVLDLNYFAKYKLSAGKFVPFIKAGFTTGYFLKDQTNLVVKRATFGELLYDAPFVKEPQKIEAGLFGGIGMAYQKLALDIRYQYNSRKVIYKIATSTISVLASYQIGK